VKTFPASRQNEPEKNAAGNVYGDDDDIENDGMSVDSDATDAEHGANQGAQRSQQLMHGSNAQSQQSAFSEVIVSSNQNAARHSPFKIDAGM
jgi:hypothetical protein